MEKYSDIIGDIKNLPPVNPPDTLVDQVMARMEKDNQSAGIITPAIKYATERHAGLDPASSIVLYSRLCGNDKYCRQDNYIRRFLLQPKTINPNAVGKFSGPIASYEQCAFLLFMVGFFYLVAGVVALWGFYDVIKEENINTWLKIQPYITIANALFLVSAAFIILYRPQVTTFVEYALIIHATFILINAYILQSIITLQFALVSVLIITILAIAFAVLLIGSIRSVLRYGTT